MEHEHQTTEPDRIPSPEKEPSPPQPYIILEGGLIANDPGLPVFDLDIFELNAPSVYDVEEAIQQAATARSLGLDGLAARYAEFTDENRNLLADDPLDQTLHLAASEGIAEAQVQGREIDAGTAASIALGLSRLLGDPDGALAQFARTLEPDRDRLRAEYQPVYQSLDTPSYVRGWIDWLNSYLARSNTDLSPPGTHDTTSSHPE
jgi:hypothetical protein